MPGPGPGTYTSRDYYMPAVDEDYLDRVNTETIQRINDDVEYLLAWKLNRYAADSGGPDAGHVRVSGNIRSTAGDFFGRHATLTGNLAAVNAALSGSVTAAGAVSSTGSGVSAATTVSAGTGMTTTTGNVTATAGGFAGKTSLALTDASGNPSAVLSGLSPLYALDRGSTAQTALFAFRTAGVDKWQVGLRDTLNNLAFRWNGTTDVLTLTSTGDWIAPSGQNFTFQPNANAAGGRLLPGGTGLHDFGDWNREWRTGFFRELSIGTLSYQEIFATGGGWIIVSPTVKLIAPVDTTQTFIDVDLNSFANGQWVQLRTAPAGVPLYEVMKIASSASGITGGYRYTVERNKDGGLANGWQTGDAVVSMGLGVNSGWLELVATNTSLGNYFGPVAVVYSRTGTTTYSQAVPTAVMGNLRSFAAYGSDIIGFATGKDLTVSPGSGFTGILSDPTNGVRMYNVNLQMYSGTTRRFLATAVGQLYVAADVDAAAASYKGFAFDGANFNLYSVDANWYNAGTRTGRFQANGLFQAGANIDDSRYNGILSTPVAFSWGYDNLPAGSLLIGGNYTGAGYGTGNTANLLFDPTYTAGGPYTFGKFYFRVGTAIVNSLDGRGEWLLYGVNGQLKMASTFNGYFRLYDYNGNVAFDFQPDGTLYLTKTLLLGSGGGWQQLVSGNGIRASYDGTVGAQMQGLQGGGTRANWTLNQYGLNFDPGQISGTLGDSHLRWQFSSIVQGVVQFYGQWNGTQHGVIMSNWSGHTNDSDMMVGTGQRLYTAQAALGQGTGGAVAYSTLTFVGNATRSFARFEAYPYAYVLIAPAGGQNPNWNSASNVRLDLSGNVGMEGHIFLTQGYSTPGHGGYRWVGTSYDLNGNTDSPYIAAGIRFRTSVISGNWAQYLTGCVAHGGNHATAEIFRAYVAGQAGTFELPGAGNGVAGIAGGTLFTVNRGDNLVGGGFRFAAGTGITLHYVYAQGANSSGYFNFDGTYINPSDGNLKTDFRPSDRDERMATLGKVRDLPLTSWKWDPAKMRLPRHGLDAARATGQLDVEHKGPTAQEWHKRFGGPVSDGVPGIQQQTVNGVVLESIQALADLQDDDRRQFASLDARVKTLEAEIAALSRKN